MLILIEAHEPLIMEYLDADTSDRAIASTIARAGFFGAKWRVSSPDEAAKICAAKRQQPITPTIPETSDEVLQLMLDMANQIQTLKADVDRINATPIPTALDLVEVKP